MRSRRRVTRMEWRTRRRRSIAGEEEPEPPAPARFSEDLGGSFFDPDAAARMTTTRRFLPTDRNALVEGVNDDVVVVIATAGIAQWWWWWSSS